MTTITPHTDPATLDSCGRQARSMVTIDAERLDAILEVIDACSLDDLTTDTAREWAAGMGLDDDSIDDYDFGAHLEGLLDYRTLRDSQGGILEIHLLVAFGGPNMWEIFNADGDVEKKLSWWGTSARSTGNHEYYARMFEWMTESGLTDM